MGNPAPAYQWLIKRRHEHEDARHQQIVRSAQWTAWASWALVALTFVGVFFQVAENREQRKQMIEQIEQQRNDSDAQRNDARNLLAVQISVELDKQFDSLEMRQARRRIATQLLQHKEVTETRLLDFLDKVGMYSHQGRIDQDTIYSSYSYWVERYWPALRDVYIKEFRKDQNDREYYKDFEELYEKMVASNVKDSGKAVKLGKSEIDRFLKEEATLPK